jgi:hypothetical protein
LTLTCPLIGQNHCSAGIFMSSGHRLQQLVNLPWTPGSELVSPATGPNEPGGRARNLIADLDWSVAYSDRIIVPPMCFCSRRVGCITSILPTASRTQELLRAREELSLERLCSVRIVVPASKYEYSHCLVSLYQQRLLTLTCPLPILTESLFRLCFYVLVGCISR